ncbi:uncharacterized protein LOC105397754 [Plutella xylostella]|uniref:uncharacterized protein LOC105397754 n=1 Tax=Plutella xylostella TaxID=51655 RepID=UPI002032B5BA|nr:uncharacterized protein LOC105397754 [Plutella xylostella]
MNEIKRNTYLEFNPNQLQEIRKQYGYEDVNVLRKTIDAIEDWIAKQNHFVVRKFDRDYIERILMNSKGSVEKTKQKLDKLCTARLLIPEFLKNFNVKTEFDILFSMAHSGILPKPTRGHHRVVFLQLHADSFERFTVLYSFRYLIVMMEYLLTHDYMAGVIWLLDFRKMNYEFITRLNPILMQKAMSISTEAYAMRLEAMYLINSSKLVSTLVAMIKQTLSDKLKSRLHVLSAPEELAGHLDLDMLPADYGGGQKTIEELHNETFKQVSSEDHIRRMEDSEREMTNEACRTTMRFNEEVLGMPGSFKSFNVD